MEILKLNFNTGSDGSSRNYDVEVPYKDGIVITSEFCPTELLSGDVELLAAIRGEPLDKFMEDCRKQVVAMSKIQDVDNKMDIHIGGLMATIMNHLSLHKEITLGEILMFMDCFALLMKGAGFEDEEIRGIYPNVAKTIQDLYSDYIKMKSV